MIRFAIVGSGYRSLFFVRIAKALPEMFEMVAMLCRTQEKADLMAREHGIKTVINEDEIVALNPDFIVSAVNKMSMSEVALYWAKKGIPVLQETPAAMDLDALKKVKKELETGIKLQVCEQYFLYPSLKAIIDAVDSGIIGEPVSLSLSAMNDHHAASIIRRMLKTDFADVSINGKTFSMKVTDTRTRYEILRDGKVVDKELKHLVMEYSDGKVAFYDFMSDQYRSPIRHRYINLRGTRGEIINDTLYYLDENNVEAERKLEIINPYESVGLNEDEAAIAQLLIRMKEYVETGKEIYPMDEALYDAHIALLMVDAGKSPYETVVGKFTDITK